MTDYRNTQDANSETSSKTNHELLSPAGQAALQGNGEVQADLNWTHVDGTKDHPIYEQAAYDAIDDPDNEVHVWNEEAVRIKNEDGSMGIGKIDTRIDHGEKTTLLDYKTNDMLNWTHSDASRHGHDHGSKMRQYMESPDTPDDSKGTLIQIGRPSKDPIISDTYHNAAAEHGVNVKFPEGGEPDDVVASVREAMDET